MKLSVALALLPAARGSGVFIGGYVAATDVFEHNRVDLDQKAMEEAFPKSWEVDAWNIYDGGGHSTKVVDLVVHPADADTSVDLTKGDLICQGTGYARCGTIKTTITVAACADVSTATSCADAGETTTIEVSYKADSSEACIQGGFTVNDGGTAHTADATAGRVFQTLTGCFLPKGSGTNELVGTAADFKVGQAGGTALINAGAPVPEYRTIAGFSSGAEGKMGVPGSVLPQKLTALSEEMYLLYKAYYGSGTYANDLVYSVKSKTAACNADSQATMGEECGYDFCTQHFCKTTTTDGVTTVDADGYVTDDTARVEVFKKASAYLTVWMYVIHELEDAIGDCLTGDIEDNEAPVHATDEAMAFYTGTSEGQSGFNGATMANTPGYLIFNLADKRCANFGTCTGMPKVPGGDNTNGGSAVNEKVASHMQDVAHYCTMLNCDKARESMNLVKAQMTVPLVQGTIRYAWYCSKAVVSLKSMAEGAVFWASIAPQVDKCDAAGAARIQNAMFRNMHGDAGTQYPAAADTLKDIVNVLQGCYSSMGITCTDVGALIAAGADNPAGVACVDPEVATGTTTRTDEELPDWALPVIIVLAVLSVVMLAMGVHARSQAAHFKEMYDTFSSGGSGKGGGARRV